MKYKFSHHNLQGRPPLEDCISRQSYRLAQKGYCGYTFSDYSDYELSLIRKWVKKQKEYIYLSGSDYFYDIDDDGYYNACANVWAPSKDLLEKFIEFLETTIEPLGEKRKCELTIKIDDEKKYKNLKKDFNNIKKKNNVRWIDLQKEYFGPILLQFEDKSLALEFKLKYECI